MSKQKIHNLDSLEKEILRLKLHQKETERRLEKQWVKLRHNFGSMFFQSFKRKKESDTNQKQGFFDSIFNNEKVDETLHNISDKIKTGVSGVVNGLFERFFRKG